MTTESIIMFLRKGTGSNNCFGGDFSIYDLCVVLLQQHDSTSCLLFSLHNIITFFQLTNTDNAWKQKYWIDSLYTII